MALTSDLTPRAAAQRLGIRLDAVYSLIWAGRLSAHKKDGRWYVPNSAIEKRLKAQASRKNATR
jgi:excisionase family DNA binding protein